MPDNCQACGAPMERSGLIDEDPDGNLFEHWHCSKICEDGDQDQEWRPAGRKMTDKERAITVLGHILSYPDDWYTDESYARVEKTMAWIRGLP